jgi:hypothetical protein
MLSNQNIKKIMKSVIRQVSTATILSLTLILSSCLSGLSGEITEEKRDVKDFTSVELAIPADISLSQGKDFSFTIEGDKEFLKEVITEVRGSALRIRTEGWVNFGWKDLKVKIQITMPTVEGLSVSGSGDINGITPINTGSLSLRVSGSGDIIIPVLTVDNLDVTISGSGDIGVAGKGTAKDAKVRVSGSGDVELKGIVFQNADISISGSGDAYIEASEVLNARVVGSGDIVYSGNPLIDAKVSGSGRIRNK